MIRQTIGFCFIFIGMVHSAFPDPYFKTDVEKTISSSSKSQELQGQKYQIATDKVIKPYF